MKKYLLRLLPVFFIVAACAVFFYPTFTRGLLPVPTDTLIGMYHPWLDQAATTNPAGVPFKNFLISDPIRQQIPWRKLVTDDLKNGISSVWNPYNFSGTPLTGNIQAGAFYPLNILFFFLPFAVAWSTLIIVQPLLAALFLYFYLRNKKVSPMAAVFAGLVWAFCGFSISWLTWGTIVQTALWLPLILLGIDKLVESDHNTSKVIWSAVMAMSSVFAFFAGHAQVALYIFAFAGLYGFFQLWRSRQKTVVWWFFAALATGLIVSSLQWVPFLQLVQHSSRLADSTAWIRDGWFLPWQNLIQFVAPDFFGNPATLNYWGTWNYGEFIGYVGIIPLMFALFAIIARRDSFTRFIAVCTGIVLIFLLPTPLARLPYQFHIPVLFALQPTRLMVLVDFCLVLLAVLGLDAYIKNHSKKIFVSIVVVGLTIAGLWIYVTLTARTVVDAQIMTNLEVSRRNLTLPGVLWVVSSVIILSELFLKKKQTGIFMLVVIIVTLFDLFRFGWKFTPFTPASYFFPGTQAVSFLQSQQKPFRVMSTDNRIMPPNVNAYYGIESIEGYDPVYDGRYEEFVAALNRREPNIVPPFGFNRIITSPGVESPLVRLLNVKYVLTLDEVRSPDLELMYREGSTRIYFYKKALPRIYPVESVVHEGTKQQVMNRLYDKTFNPAKTAVVEDVVSVPVRQLAAGDSIRITSYNDSVLTAISVLSEDHFTVIANMFNPNWRVTIDGVAQRIYRTNYLFLGVLVPKGSHTIRVSYE